MSPLEGSRRLNNSVSMVDNRIPAPASESRRFPVARRECLAPGAAAGLGFGKFSLRKSARTLARAKQEPPTELPGPLPIPPESLRRHMENHPHFVSRNIPARGYVSEEPRDGSGAGLLEKFSLSGKDGLPRALSCGIGRSRQPPTEETGSDGARGTGWLFPEKCVYSHGKNRKIIIKNDNP